jgi:hypothetical protein
VLHFSFDRLCDQHLISLLTDPALNSNTPFSATEIMKATRLQKAKHPLFRALFLLTTSHAARCRRLRH